jgi:hypothetical protein
MITKLKFSASNVQTSGTPIKLKEQFYSTNIPSWFLELQAMHLTKTTVGKPGT